MTTETELPTGTNFTPEQLVQIFLDGVDLIHTTSADLHAQVTAGGAEASLLRAANRIAGPAGIAFEGVEQYRTEDDYTRGLVAFTAYAVGDVGGDVVGTFMLGAAVAAAGTGAGLPVALLLAGGAAIAFTVSGTNLQILAVEAYDSATQAPTIDEVMQAAGIDQSPFGESVSALQALDTIPLDEMTSLPSGDHLARSFSSYYNFNEDLATAQMGQTASALNQTAVNYALAEWNRFLLDRGYQIDGRGPAVFYDELGDFLETNDKRLEDFNLGSTAFISLLKAAYAGRDDVFQFREDACFAPGTMVSMADGTTKRIEHVVAGDSVLSFAENAEDGRGALEPRKVVRTFTTPNQPLLRLGDILVTPGHMMLGGDGKFHPLADIIASNGTLVDAGGAVVSLPYIEEVEGKHTVYNFEVEGNHTYVADGLRVHNRSLRSYLGANEELTNSGFDANGVEFTESVDKTDGTVIVRRGYDVDGVAGTDVVEESHSYVSGGVPVVVTETWRASDNNIGSDGVRQGDGELSIPDWNGQFINGQQFGSVFGSALGNYLSDNAFERVAYDAAFNSIFVSTGKAFDIYNNGFSHKSGTAVDSLEESFDIAFSDFGTRVGAGVIKSGISQVSTFLASEVIGGEGIAADLGRTVFKDFVSSALTEVAIETAGAFEFVDLVEFLGGDLDAIGSFDLNFNPASAIGGFFGSSLANSIIQPNTKEGALVSSVVSGATQIALSSALSGTISSTASFVASAALSIGTAFIGAFVGTLLGNIIGSLFNDEDWPRAAKYIGIDGNGRAYLTGGAALDGMSQSDVEQFGAAVVEGYNAILDLMGPGAYLSSPSGALGTIGYIAGDGYIGEDPVPSVEGFVASRPGYSESVWSQINFDPTKFESAYNFLLTESFEAGEFQGGDAFSRRVRNYGGATTLDEFVGLLKIADEYRRYLANKAIIDRLIAEAPDSAFAVGWIATIAQAYALDLHNPNALHEKIDGTTNSELLGGTQYNDEISAVAGNDTLYGFGGNDLLRSGTGADYIDGGEGADTVSYRDSVGGVTVNLETQSATGGSANGDTLVSIERVIGSGYGDIITGNEADNILAGGGGNDTINGGLGDDTIEGGAGADTLEGGDGYDVASYATSQEGVKVHLDGTNGEGGDGAGDTLSGFEAINGSQFGDFLIGSAGDELLLGNGGSDLLQGGAGEDRLIGGDGFDFAVYSDSNASVSVNLVTGEVSGGFAEGDTIIEIENVIGSAYDDTIVGDAFSNIIEGGAGADMLDGGEGEDVLSYAGSSSGVSINTVTNTFSGGDAEGDVVSNFENYIGSNFDDEFTVHIGDNVTILAGDGDDVIRAVDDGVFVPGGSIRIDGGAGVDRADFAALSGGVNVQPLYQNAGYFFGSRWGMSHVNFGSDIYTVWAAISGGGVVNTSSFSSSTNDYEVGVHSVEVITTTSFDDIIDFDDETNLQIGDLGVFAQAVNAGGGNDVIRGKNGHDWFDGDAGNDTLFGGLGNDALHGGDGNDVLYGEATEAVHAYTGFSTMGWAWGGISPDSVVMVDSLQPYGADDRLDGGAGDDVLHGHYGDDTYVLGRGYGSDTIYDQAFGIQQGYVWDKNPNAVPQTIDVAGPVDAGSDTIEIEAGLSLGDLDFYAPNIFDLIIRIRGTNDQVTIKGWFDDLSRVEYIRFAETGTTHLIESIDQVRAVEIFGSRNFPRPSDVVVSAYSALNISNVNIGPDDLVGSEQADRIYGFEALNTIYGLGGDDLIEPGDGADTVDGGEGSDTVSYEPSSAGVTIDLHGNIAIDASGATDTLVSIENALGSFHNDVIYSSAIANVINGNDGIDQVDYRYSSGAVQVDLAAGTASGGFAAGDVLTGIERVHGSAFNDTLTGDAGDNVLWGYLGSNTLAGLGGNDTILGGDGADQIDGGDGNDTLIGGAGADVLDGGDGFDTASYYSSSGAVAIDLTADTVTGADAEGDTFISIEQIVGSDHADVLSGDAASNMFDGGAGNDTIAGRDGDDTLRGGAGDDSIAGGAGADIIDGGDGVDVADYSASAAAITINLAAGVASGGDAEGDQLSNIENIVGTDHDDTIYAGHAANNLNAGTGTDTLSYAASDAGVTASLATGSGSGGWAEGDVLAGFENLEGSANADTLYGDSGNNVLRGLGGDDSLFGGAGNDHLTGGAGADSFRGGEGADRIDGGSGGDIAWYDDSAAGVTVDLGATGPQAGGTAEGDELTGIENLAGSSHDDVLYGNDDANVIVGGAGVDTIEGRGGDDTIYGGAGADILDGGAGTDTVSYASSDAAVTVDLALATAQSGGAAAGDMLAGFENLSGSAHDDLLQGTDGANTIEGGGGADTIHGRGGDDTLLGGAGNDTFIGSAGADIIDGGDGTDLADYSASADGVNVNLASGAATGGDAAGDQLSSIESVRASDHDDEIHAGEAINDLDAGLGTDTVSYAASDAAVTVDLHSGIGTGGWAQGDTLSGFENVVGSAYGDTLTGGAGANTLDGRAGDDSLFGGDGDDTLIGGAGADAFFGGTGTDTVSYAGAATGVVVNIDVGSTLNGDAVGDTFDSIENLTGSSFGDQLWAGAGINHLQGGDGDDLLDGGSGMDILDGGAGSDWATYAQTGGGVIVDLSTGTTGGWDTGDTLISIENVLGSAYNDTLIGDAEDNTLEGGAGADVIDGGAGFDTASYASSSSGVSVNLITGLHTGDAQGDVLTSIERIVGSVYTDDLRASTVGMTLDGGGGDDNLVSGAGADHLIGGAGQDWGNYWNSTSAVNVNLATGEASGGYAEGDAVSQIEFLSGSFYDDDLTGDDTANTILGNDGNDILTGGAGNDTLEGGNGDDVLEGGDGADILDGGVGDNIVSYSSSSSGVSVNLASGYTAGGDAAGDTLIGFNNLRGSAFADELIGGATSNHLEGGGGDDVLTGQSGSDILDGGAGSDWATYAQTGGGVIVDLSTGTTGGWDTGDTLISIENVLGSAYNDTLIGDAGDNILDGFGGADALDGGAGFDTASYVNADAAVYIRTDGTAGLWGHSTGDTLVNIERIVGSAYDDSLYADINGISPVGATLEGGDGNDNLVSGTGADHLIGGAGQDWANYFYSTAGVAVDLAAGTASGGHAAGDTLTSIELLWGSNHDDVLTGDAGDNTLSGNDGNDILTGGAGNDTLEGGNGDDVLEGGAGADAFFGGTGADTVSYASAATGVVVNIDVGSTLNGDAVGDTFDSIENLTGSAFGDQLWAGAGVNHLQGGDGDDLLDGGTGMDILDGGAGSDWAWYQNRGGGVVVDLSTGTTGGWDAGDTLISIENVFGSAYDDALTGDAGDNILEGAGGADVLDGGAGFDTASYSNADAAVYIRTDGTAGLWGHSTGDTLVNIERIVGSAYDDSLYADINGISPVDATLEGGDGNDNLVSGTGADHLIGGAGQDWANYFFSTAGVAVDLAAGTASGGHAAGDTLTSIELLWGSNHDDVLTGDAGENTLSGNDGNDILTGGAGNDTLEGGNGFDTYLVGRGGGADLVSSVGADASGGRIDFGTGVNFDQLWFDQSGDDLLVSVIGTSDSVTVENFFASAPREVTEFKANGATLNGSAESQAVATLVSAMAAFSPPSSGQLNLDQAVRDDSSIAGALAAWSI